MPDRHFDQPTRLNSTSFTGILVRVGSRSMLDENSRFNCYAAYIRNTKSQGSYSSTARRDRVRGEALAEGCRGAADANDVATPTSGLEGTGADRVGSWGFPRVRRSPSFGRHSAVCSCARCEILVS